MANQAHSTPDDNQVYRHCVSYIVLFDNVLLIHNRVLWALYARDEDRFLSEFIFTKPPGIPRFGEEHIWSLFIEDHEVLFDAKARIPVLRNEVVLEH